MRNYILGIMTAYTLAFTHQFYGAVTNSDVDVMLTQNKILGNYLLWPLILNRCSSKKAVFLHTGQEHVIAEWYGCDGFQKFINIERD